MRTLVVVAHPDPDSLTQALSKHFCSCVESAGGETELLDLYQEGFDPVASPDEFKGWFDGTEPAKDVRRSQELISRADAMVLVYPVWWGTPPAILQGWLQRVMTRGFAFSFDETGAHGLLPKKAGLIVSVGSQDHALRNHYIEPIEGVLRYCGFEIVADSVNWGVYPGVGAEKVEQALDDAYGLAQSFS